MTAAPKVRAHLVERAIAAIGGAGSLLMPVQREIASTAETTQPPVTPTGEATPPSAAAPPKRQLIDCAALVRAGFIDISGSAVRNRLSEEISVVQQQVVQLVKKMVSDRPDGRCSRAILVTSARPKEGKSFLSLNIAASIATGGAMPVILVDVDGKFGSLTELLGCAEEPGLRLLAANPSASIESLLLPTALKKLSILPYGPVPMGSEPVPPSATVAAAVQRVAAAWPNHVVILDSPPCLATSDAASLAAIVGQVLMVVAAEQTQRNEVEAALDMVDACPTIQLVLNQTRLTSNDSFGAYGYGGYGG